MVLVTHCIETEPSCLNCLCGDLCYNVVCLIQLDLVVATDVVDTL